ncbi:universal stress protein PHOS34-like [Punica granatum]|uniref:Universal stress protein PHOS34-like n=1 Tax=Punica granatum TaxID=22663 RepID=A0A218WZ30_PUNGR|nr:universal stress protein PHOS34-like [Punica granatum]OWM77964.1 hypothetical protein CDL15_Pgr018533 [Punica granatum]
MATGAEKQVMVVGIDESDHSLYALRWTIDRFFAPFSPNPPFKLVLVHAKPHPAKAGLHGPATAEVITYIDKDLKVMSARVTKKAKGICSRRSIQDVTVEVVEGDPRTVLCESTERHRASVLVVGSRGYGAIKRAVLGSVSDYCAHHARCTVMIVKKPNIKN